MNNDRSIFTVVDYGRIVFDIKPVMDNKKISVSKIVKQTGLHHKVVNRYYEGNITRYDSEILAKLCYILNCELIDIMKYEKPKN